MPILLRSVLTGGLDAFVPGGSLSEDRGYSLCTLVGGAACITRCGGCAGRAM
jgi:hypothetical protein